MPHQNILSPCRRSNPSAYQDPQGTRRAPFALFHQHFKAILCYAIQCSAKEWVQQCTKVLCGTFSLKL